MKGKKDDGSMVSALANALTRNPLPVLLLTCVSVSLMCIGYTEYDVIKDVAKLWIQEGSIVGNEIDYMDDHSYDVDATTTQLITTVRYPNIGDNVMNEYTLEKHFEAALRVNQVNVTYGGHMYGYNDVCDTTTDYLIQCVRVTALDCFKEGGFDFPAFNGLATLQGFLDSVEPVYIDAVRGFVVSTGEGKMYETYRANPTTSAYINASLFDNTTYSCGASNETMQAVVRHSVWNLYGGDANPNAVAKVDSFGTRGSETWNLAMLNLAAIQNEINSTYVSVPDINNASSTPSYAEYKEYWKGFGGTATLAALVEGLEDMIVPLAADLYGSHSNTYCGINNTDDTALSAPRQCSVRLYLANQIPGLDWSAVATTRATFAFAFPGLTFDATNYASERVTYLVGVGEWEGAKLVVNVDGTTTFNITGRNIAADDLIDGSAWLRWWVDNECPNFVASSECVTLPYVDKLCAHYDAEMGTNLHSITEEECVSTLKSVIQDVPEEIQNTVLSYFGAETAEQTPYYVVGFLEQRSYGQMSATNRSDCLAANGNPTDQTIIKRTIAICQILYLGNDVPYDTANAHIGFAIDVTNDLNYYTFMSESFLTSYGLEGMINPTDWTQNFPLVSILRAYMQIAGETPISAQDPTTFECDSYTFTFTNVSHFYTEFIAAGCPRVGIDLNDNLYCGLDSNCQCQSNEYGITPYSARPSFRGMSDAEIAQELSKTCYYWDGGLAYPSVPSELVLGRPEPTNAVESGVNYTHVNGYEFVLYNNDKERFQAKMATRLVDRHPLTVDEAEIILEMWMDAFMEAAPEKKESDTESSDGLGIMTNSYSSKTFNDILDDASGNAYPLLITGLLLIYFYAFVTTGLSLLSLGGVSLVLLGTVGGIGLSLGFGVSLNATTINVLPFLMLGLGVDDMFIFHRTLMQFRERSDVKQMSPEDQVAAVLREAGPCVCLTTFTNFCAFMIGTLTPLPVVQQFALTASITVIVSWFTNLVGFNALCVLSLKYTPDLSLSGAICGSSSNFSFASWSKNIVETKISPFLTNTMTRVITVIFFIGLWGLSGYGVSEIEMGLSVSEICKDGTQEKDFLKVRDDYFAFYSTDISAYADVAWHEPDVQQEYLRVEEAVYEISYNLRRVDSWLRQFLKWCSSSSNPLFEADQTNPCQKGPTVDECGSYFGCEVNNVTGFFDSGVNAFTMCLNEWYTFTTVTSSPAFYPLDTESNPTRDLITYPIEFVRFPLYSQKMWTTDDFVKMIDETRDVIDSSSLDLFPLGIAFTFWEQYRNLEILLLQNLGVAVVCTFIIGTLSIYIATNSKEASVFSKILKSAHGSIIMCFAMMSTMISLLGFMGLAGIWLSAIPALTVIAAMGICVDLTALMTLFFCSSSGSHDDRIQKALVAVFVPTVDSMLSTIFGCVALAGSEISLYVKFFFWMYFAVAVLGCLNGLLLLPVLLAWAGPSEFGGNPTATAKVSDVFSEPKGTADTKTKHPL